MIYLCITISFKLFLSKLLQLVLKMFNKFRKIGMMLNFENKGKKSLFVQHVFN